MRRAIAGTGRVFITAGVLILLFVAYQLWGTGFFERRAQAELRGDFEEQLEGQPRTSSTTADDGSTPSTTTTTTTVPPPAPIPPGGEPVAIIRIPKIGVDKVVVEGTAVADLRKGPGHYGGTPLPGQEGNAAIAGHRTTYGAPFGDLDQLVPGDLISVQTLAGTWDYAVAPEGVFAVHPGQIEVLDPTPDATLTLTTCHPKYSASERLVVKAQLERDEEPLPAPPETRRPPNLDAGLSGTRDSRIPTILWGMIAAALGALWWLAFHRRRGLVTWVAGALPFAAALFVFYSFLERVLPSNY